MGDGDGAGVGAREGAGEGAGADQSGSRERRKTWRPKRANTARAKSVRMMTSRRFLTEYTMAETMVLRPGMTATDFRALKTATMM